MQAEALCSIVNMNNDGNPSEESNGHPPYQFKTITYSTVMKYLVGPDKIRQVEVYPSFNSIPTPLPAGWERHIETVMNSCAFNTAISAVAGLSMCLLNFFFYHVCCPVIVTTQKLCAICSAYCELPFCVHNCC